MSKGIQTLLRRRHYAGHHRQEDCQQNWGNSCMTVPVHSVHNQTYTTCSRSGRPIPKAQCKLRVRKSDILGANFDFGGGLLSEIFD